MQIKVLKSKLHRGTVTSAKVQYPGSIGIDPDLLEAAGIVPYECVLVADLENGNRLETYAIEAGRGTGAIEILGAAARLIHAGDRVIVMAFGLMSPEQARSLKPKVVVLGQGNRILSAPETEPKD